MNGLFSISGLASGIDTDTMIERIMEFSRRPINQLNSRIEEKTRLLTAVKLFEANLQALKIELRNLSKAQTFEAKLANVSNDSILTASATSAVPAGLYTLTVNQLAQNHQVASVGFSDTDETIGTGTFSLTVGGRETMVIEIDSENNTLDSLVQAINDANGDVQATIINSGDPVAPYKMLLTSKHTGASERIEIENDLVGGTPLTFGEVESVVYGIHDGSSDVTSSGSYTGPETSSVVFVVQDGGKMGKDDIIIDYFGTNISGSFTIPSDYVPGEKIETVGGIELSFSAGNLKDDDTFSVDVTTANIQDPLDAEYKLGSGATGLTLTSTTNTITNMIDGLTLELHQASAEAVTLNIAPDREGVRETITTFVDQYNAFVDFMRENTKFDQEFGVAGELLSETATQEVYRGLQSRVTGSVSGIQNEINHLVAMGIQMDQQGFLQINEDDFNEALDGDLEALASVFTTDAQVSDPNIQFLLAGSETVAYEPRAGFPQGYDIKITQAATRALYAAASITDPASSPIVIGNTNNSIKINVNGRESSPIAIAAGTYATGAELAAAIQAGIDNDASVGVLGLDVTYVDEGGTGHLEFKSSAYGSNSVVEFKSTGNDMYAAIGVTVDEAAEGKDVEGTIAGEKATGVGQILTGDNDNKYTDGLQMLVTLSEAQLLAQGEYQGTIKVTKGMASKVNDYIDLATRFESGRLTLKTEELNESIGAFEDQIERMEERLDKKRIRLLKEFQVMEQLISDLNGQSDFLAGALQNITANSRTANQRSR